AVSARHGGRPRGPGGVAGVHVAGVPRTRRLHAPASASRLLGAVYLYDGRDQLATARRGRGVARARTGPNVAGCRRIQRVGIALMKRKPGKGHPRLLDPAESLGARLRPPFAVALGSPREVADLVTTR